MYVLNVEELKTISIPPVNTEIVLGGYYQINDNGGGIFIWKEGLPIPPEDDGIIIHHSTDNSGWFERVVIEPYLHINWFGAKSDGINDDAIPLQKAIDYLGELGGIIMLGSGESYTWKSVPKIPRNISGHLIISGYGATVKLTDTGDCFCEVNKIADHDTFKNITLQGFNIDGNNIGGKTHILFGTYRNSVSYQKRLNFDNIILKDIDIFNVPTDNTLTNHRIGVLISSYHSSGGETQTSITNIFLENVRMQGGNGGFIISGNGPSVDNTNVWLDNISIINCSHACDEIPSSFFTSSNMQIGQNSTGGKVSVVGFYGENAGDNGIEINGFKNAIVTNTTIKNPFNLCFFLKNFKQVDDFKSQYATYLNCSAIIDDLPSRVISVSGVNKFGNIRMTNQTLTKNGRFSAGSYMAFNLQPNISSGHRLHSLVLDGYDINWIVSGTQTADAFPSLFWLSTDDTETLPITLKDINVNIRGSWDNSGGYLYKPAIFILDNYLDIVATNIHISWDVTSPISTIIYPFVIGQYSTLGKINTEIYNYTSLILNSNVTCRNVQIYPETKVALDSASSINFYNSEFTTEDSLGANVDFYWGTGTNNVNRQFVLKDGIRADAIGLTSQPTINTWTAGEIIYNANPSTGPAGWYVTKGGAIGTAIFSPFGETYGKTFSAINAGVNLTAATIGTASVCNIYLNTGNTTQTVTLPPVANAKGITVNVFKLDTGTGGVTVDGSGSETINGLASETISGQFAYGSYKCNGIAWYTSLQSVNITTDQNITGVKTFLNAPIVPNPTMAGQATNKGSVDALLAGKQNLLTDLFLPSGNLGLGNSSNTTINSASTFGASVTPRFETITTATAPPYTEFNVIRHTNNGGTNPGLRMVGQVFKLSTETSAGESSKMAAVYAGSENIYSNSPYLGMMAGNFEGLRLYFDGTLQIMADLTDITTGYTGVLVRQTSTGYMREVPIVDLLASKADVGISYTKAESDARYELITQIKSGNATITADGLQTTFSISHSMGSTSYEVSLESTTFDAAIAKQSGYYITNKTAALFDIVFLVAPVMGDIIFDYILHKN